ncbi:TRAP transporter large permease [Leucobacter chinensis]|uniref:TRAP transporter large permease n=1 Tax=Leucobacter chinensis TaxID=2851010 RepID=UPI001C22747B|nr:TRAP transporter large permease [Leucobacter chinensis]
MIELILFGTFAVFLLIGMPVAFALGLSAIIAVTADSGLYFLGTVPGILYSTMSAETLLAIPFFVLAGVLMEYAGISQNLINLADAFVGHRKNGIALVAIIAVCFFAAMSGSAPATVAALGSILIPALIKNGYQPKHATSLLASAGAIGIVLPPSIPLIIFAVVASDYMRISIGRLFMAGIVPGILMAIAFYLVCLYLPKSRDVLAQKVGPKGAQLMEMANVAPVMAHAGGTPSNAVSEWAPAKAGDASAAQDTLPGGPVKATNAERMSALVKAIPGLLIPVIIFGGIYGGIFTATESAIVAVVYTLILAVISSRGKELRKLALAFIRAAVQSATIMIIIGLASLFAYVVTSELIAVRIAQAMISFTDNKFVIILLVTVILLIVGMFLDNTPAFYLLIPILVPVMLEAGIDITTIGITMTVNMALGLITPPVGINLFIASGIAKIPVMEAVRGIGPFLIAGLAVLMLLSFVPAISNFLPDLLGV